MPYFYYLPVRETLFRCEIGKYLTYGISSMRLDGICMREEAFFSDFSRDFETARQAAAEATFRQISPFCFAQKHCINIKG